MRLLFWLVFVICGFIMNLLPNIYFILQIYHAKSFKMRHVTSLYFNFVSMIFIKCFKNSILLSGSNRTLERPSYSFSLILARIHYSFTVVQFFARSIWSAACLNCLNIDSIPCRWKILSSCTVACMVFLHFCMPRRKSSNSGEFMDCPRWK